MRNERLICLLGVAHLCNKRIMGGGEAVSKVPVAEIDSMVPADVVKTLVAALQAKPLDHTTVETCCMRACESSAARPHS